MKIKTTIYSEPLYTTPPSPKADEHAELGRFDSGLLPDWEGGSVDWWQDSIRNLLESAHDHYQEQHEEHCAFSKKMTAQLLINWGEALNEAKNPKAEWDAEGNPLNLEAAARAAERGLNGTLASGFITESATNWAISNLRKFLKD